MHLRRVFCVIGKNKSYQSHQHPFVSISKRCFACYSSSRPLPSSRPSRSRPIPRCNAVSSLCFPLSKLIGKQINDGIIRNYTVSSRLAFDDQEANKLQIRKAVINLDLDINRMNRIYRTDLENILQNIIAADLGPVEESLDVGIVLLQCCGDLMADEIPSTRVKLAHRIWNTLQHLGATLKVQHFNALLACYVDNNHSTSMAEFLSTMGDVKPDEQTFICLLWIACDLGDLEQATNIISSMKECGFPVSESMFNALVYGHARSLNLASAYGVLETMKTALLVPSAATYTALLRGLAKSGNVDDILKAYQETLATSTPLSEAQILAILKSVAVSGHVKLVPVVLAWLSELSAEGSHSMSHVLVHLVHLGCDKSISLMLDKMPQDESSPFGKFLITEMVKANRPATNIVKLGTHLTSSERNSLALSHATEAALRFAKTDLALDLLTAMKLQTTTLRPHFFWPLILTEVRSRGEEGVFYILRYMQELGVTCDQSTLSGFVLPHVSLALPVVLVRKLQSHGLSLNTVLSPLVGALLKLKKADAALQLCKTYSARLDCGLLVRPLVVAYLNCTDINSTLGLIKVMETNSKEKDDWAGRFLLEILTNKKPKAKTDQLRDIVKAFGGAGFRCSSFAGDVVSQHISRLLPTAETTDMIETLSKMVDTEVTVTPTELFTHHIPHPRDMNLEELECHLVELKAKNLNTRGVLRRLLQLYCRQNNAEKALQIKREFEEGGYEFSYGMQAAMFDLYVQLGLLDKAKACLSELTRATDFNLDEYKVVDFAALLVKCKKDEEALKLLEKHAAQGTVKGGPSLTRNCRLLLNAMAERGEPDATRILLEILVKCGYCTVSNIILGPLVRAHIKRKDLESAVNEFKNCASQYKSTPLQHELMCLLVEAADGKSELTTNGKEATDLLESVLDVGRKIHGEASTQVALIVALAETGRTKQLQRLLRDPQTKLRMPLLMNRCRRLVDENKLEALHNLVTSFRGLASFNVTPIFTLMLQVHCRRGDCDRALLLWTSMQDLDYRPSSEFLVTLAELLRSHKREIPFVVPTIRDTNAGSNTSIKSHLVN